jgi:hypothetical protein
MLPPELVRYIYEFVVPEGVSWRAEHHLNILDDQNRSVQFKRIQHNYVHELSDRYCILDIPSIKRYVNDSIIYKDDFVRDLQGLCCSVWVQERNTYLCNYRSELYKRAWNPYRPVYVLGRHIQCTIPPQAYTRLLRFESMRTTGYMNGQWSGCVPRDVYCTECIANWSIY